MQIALRKGAAKPRTAYTKASAVIIESVLKTVYPHCGVVIRGVLYHAAAKHGLTSEPFINDPDWLLLDCGDERDDEIIQQFNDRLLAGGGKVNYDWVSLFAFTPINFIARQFGGDIRYSKWIYCFEWVYEVLVGKPPEQRVTAETILVIYLTKYVHK